MATDKHAQRPSGPFTDDQLKVFLHRPVDKLIGWVGLIGGLASIVGLAITVIGIVAQLRNFWVFATLILSILLLLAILFAWYQRRATTSTRLKWLQQPDPALVYNLMARIIGVTRDKYIKVVTVKKDGSAETDSEFTVRAVNRAIHWVEHKSTLLDHPDESAGARVDVVVPHAAGKGIRPVRLSRPGGRTAVYQLHIEPFLQVGQEVRIRGLRMRQPADTFATVRRGTTEWTSVQALYPCDELTLEVRFSDGNAPEGGANFDVWFGDARMQHTEEVTRIRAQGGFEYQTQGANMATAILKVAYPIPDLRYAITWQPPG